MPDKVSPKNNVLQVNLPNEQDEVEANSMNSADKKTSEAAIEVDLAVEEPDGAALGPNSLIEFEGSESEQANAILDKGIDIKNAGKRQLQIQGKWKGVDPVIFFKDEAIINSIKTFYGIDESFPLTGHLVSRNLDNNHVKRIYYLSKSARDVLELNFSVGQQLKIASIGLKMFVSINVQNLNSFSLENAFYMLIM